MARYEVELAEALGLPRIKKDKLVKALKAGSTGPPASDELLAPSPAPAPAPAPERMHPVTSVQQDLPVTFGDDDDDDLLDDLRF